MAILVPVSWGELLDKITILRIKVERITDPEKNANVRKELTQLEAIADRIKPLADDVEALLQALYEVNLALWDIEDEIRSHERQKQYDDRFIELARSVYITNDKRSELKRALNAKLDSDLVEEKSYEPYS